MVGGRSRCRIGSRRQVGCRCHQSRLAVKVVAVSAVIVGAIHPSRSAVMVVVQMQSAKSADKGGQRRKG
jgi:hypothetical protein